MFPKIKFDSLSSFLVEILLSVNFSSEPYSWQRMFELVSLYPFVVVLSDYPKLLSGLMVLQPTKVLKSPTWSGGGRSHKSLGVQIVYN